MPNYSYIVPTQYSPFTFQEMLAPMEMYAERYDQMDEAYNTLQENADKFKYLSKALPEGSKSKQIYEGYAKDLEAQANDFMRRGLTQGGRAALSSLRRRYSGEIGRLSMAQTALEKEKELRRQMATKDNNYLYATDNMTIDDFLDGNTPNLYGISGNELYAQGSVAGKAASSRIFSAGDGGSTLGGYYRDWVQRNGYSAESINAFRQNIAAIPELQQAAMGILQQRGVDQNLTGVNYQRALQSVVNGIIDGAIYSESHSPQRDLGMLTASETANLAMQQQQLEWQKQKAMLEAQGAEGTGGVGGASSYNPVPMYSPKKISENKEKADKYLKKGYFEQDVNGNYYLTKKGAEEFNNTSGGIFSGGRASYSDFRKFMNELGADKLPLDGAAYTNDVSGRRINPKGHWGSWQKHQLGKLFNTALSGEGSYDTYHSTNFIKDLDKEEDRTNYTNKLFRSSTNSDHEVALQPVDWSQEKGWFNDGDPIILDKDTIKGTKVTALGNSQWGAVARVQLSDGTNRWVRYNDINVNSTMARNSRMRYAEAAKLIEVLHSPLLPQMIDSNGKNISWNEITATSRIKTDKKGSIVYSGSPMTSIDRMAIEQRINDILILAERGL